MNDYEFEHYLSQAGALQWINFNPSILPPRGIGEYLCPNCLNVTKTPVYYFGREMRWDFCSADCTLNLMNRARELLKLTKEPLTIINQNSKRVKAIYESKEGEEELEELEEDEFTNN